MQNKIRGVIIFDLDGTLYELVGGSFRKSLLRKKVLDNACRLIADKLKKNRSDAQKVLKKIRDDYGEHISIGLEKEFDIDRQIYFNTVWNISTQGIIKKEAKLRKTILELNKFYKLILLSDAPRVWISCTLKALNVDDIFANNIYSGEGDFRKGFSNAFREIIKKIAINPKQCIAVGDQEDTDIIPAKQLGMRTVFIAREKRSQIADHNILKISDLLALL